VAPDAGDGHAGGLCIFIYSLGYMAHDPNFTRFFCFLSLFAGRCGRGDRKQPVAAVVCWELVGLASYLLIGFWYQNRRGGGGKKAFITTALGTWPCFSHAVAVLGAGTLCSMMVAVAWRRRR